MEVSLLDKTSLKIKSKRANFIVDPFEKLSKTSADAIIVLSESSYNTDKVTDYRVVIKAPGDYEVSGVKITGIDFGGSTVYDLSADGMDILLANSYSLEKISLDKIGEYAVTIINVNSELNQSLITAMEPSAVILYGEKAAEAAKLLGKGDEEAFGKFSITKEKLPEEMQVILLK